MKDYIVVGYRPYSGTFEGNAYSGFYCHVICLQELGNGFVGRSVRELKIKSKFNYTPSVGDEISVEYGEGGIESVVKVNSHENYFFR